MIVPLMIFHQMQLMVCAVLARRYAEGERKLTPEPHAESPSGA
jgi:sodium/bile acid cotransporter 7